MDHRLSLAVVRRKRIEFFSWSSALAAKCLVSCLRLADVLSFPRFRIFRLLLCCHAFVLKLSIVAVLLVVLSCQRCCVVVLIG